MANWQDEILSIYKGESDPVFELIEVDTNEYKIELKNTITQEGTPFAESSIATQEEAESGVANDKLMTPLRVKEAIERFSDTRYGVRFTGSASAGERLYNAVGLTANVGVDSTEVTNDFDNILPWAGMKRCNTKLIGGERVPTHFEGETGYDNINDNVYVKVPLFYYHRSNDDSEHVVSMQPLAGYSAPAKFYRTDGTLRDYVFLPAYTAGLVGGVPVSRGGQYPHITSLNGWMSLLSSKHTSDELEDDIWIESTKDDEIKNILMDIEFATRDHQTYMLGACQMRYTSADTATVAETGVNRVILPTASANEYVVGQAIAIGSTDNASDIANNYTITSITAYDASNSALNFANDTAVDISVGNYIRSRPWKSGACDSVVASSGSVNSNSDGKNPCIYRGVENPYANIWQWRWDYLQNNHQPYILENPDDYAAGAISGDYNALNYTVPTSNGYATEMGYDENYPFARVTKAVGGSSTTYFADYFYQNTGVRALLVGGSLTDGRGAGSRSFNVPASPSDSYWGIGAALSPA